MFSTDDTSIDLLLYITSLQKFFYCEITASFNMHVIKMGNLRQNQQTPCIVGTG